MARKKTAAAADIAVATETTTVIAYKGFDADLSCRGHKFEIGKSYSVEGKVVACQNGFHACEHPTSVLQFYPAINGTRYCQVELSGDMDVDGEKTAARTITPVRELTLTELINEAVAFTVARAKIEEGEKATGEQGAASATGNRGAASATGEQGAASATGNRGAASATGKASAAMASGFEGKALGAEGCALFLVERLNDWRSDDHGKILHVWAGIVGQDGIKPDTFYRLLAGKPVEVV